jgi:hypothetical protein
MRLVSSSAYLTGIMRRNTPAAIPTYGISFDLRIGGQKKSPRFQSSSRGGIIR